MAEHITVLVFRHRIPPLGPKAQREMAEHITVLVFPPSYSAARSQSTKRDGEAYYGARFSALIFRR